MLDEEYGMFYIDNKIISLSESETDILSLLIKYKYRLVTYEEIYYELYLEKKQKLGKKELNRFRIVLKRLREKLKGYVRIKTITGKGILIDMR